MSIWLTLLLMAGEALPVRVATYAYPAYDRAAALAPMARLIGDTLGRPVRVELYGSPEALRTAIDAGNVDVAMTNLAAFVGVANARARPIAMLDVPAATLERYRGVLVARRDADVARVSALREHAARLRYSEVLPGSTSGALVQAGLFRRLGLSRSGFKAVRHAGTHEAALDDLLAGRADLAAFAEEPWRKLVAERPTAAASLIELWRSEPLPPGPVLCVEGPALPCAKVAAALVNPDAASANAAQALAAGWSETAGARQFRTVGHSDYAGFAAPVAATNNCPTAPAAC